MADALDPKTIITADAFTVAPHLLGTPLARPARRAFAMLLDLVLVGIMIKAIGFTFLALAAGLLLFRVARPSGKGGVMRRGAALGVRFAGVIMFAAFGLALLGNVRDFVRSPVSVLTSNDDEPNPEPEGDYQPQFNITDARALRHVAMLESSADEATARVHADSLVAWIQERSDDPAEQAQLARWVQARSSAFDQSAALAAALRPLAGDTPRAGDAATLRAYADVVESGDTAGVDSLRTDAQNALAGARIQQLERSLVQSEENVEQLNERLERQQEGGGILQFIAGLGNDLGVGFGWMAVYFTAFVVLWNGQTPGKRLLGIRIIRLDAKPLSWWLAFERFGGYAASLSTGLLGFAQILWDRNRQGMHDKITSTVVIVDGAPRVDVPPRAAHYAPRPPASAPPGSRPPV